MSCRTITLLPWVQQSHCGNHGIKGELDLQLQQDFRLITTSLIGLSPPSGAGYMDRTTLLWSKIFLIIKNNFVQFSMPLISINNFFSDLASAFKVKQVNCENQTWKDIYIGLK